MKYSKQELLSILEKTGKLFNSHGFHVFLEIKRNGMTRFANNEITDNQVYADTVLHLHAYLDNREGYAKINQLDLDLVQEAVKRAETMAQLAPKDPEFVGPPSMQEYSEFDAFDNTTAMTTPENRVSIINNAVTKCKKQNLVTAGFLATQESTFATLSSSGAVGYHGNTTVKFSLTVKTSDGSGSGWALRWTPSIDQLNVDELIDRTIIKAETSKNPQTISPGRYNVVLEPVACEYLLYHLTYQMDARDTEEGRTFLSKFDTSGKPVGTKVGEKVFSELLTLSRQVSHPKILAHPFDRYGIALKDITFVKNGVLENLPYDRYWAKKKNVVPTGESTGLVMTGQGNSVEDLCKQAGDGILVTRLWYIRNVNKMKSAVTGITRDGTFRIEGGKIVAPVKNLRFNEELRRVFKDIQATGQTDSFWTFLCPAIFVPDFKFTSITDSI